MLLTHERLVEVLYYDPLTGLFRWRVPKGRAPVGWFSGAQHGSGYLVISVDGTNYRAHRLAWLYVKGKWPLRTIDHRNRVKADNRAANLRDVSIRLNSQNHSAATADPLCGIERRENGRGERWRARISHFGRLVTVGTYNTKQEAIAAMSEARMLMHPGFIPGATPEL